MLRSVFDTKTLVTEGQKLKKAQEAENYWDDPKKASAESKKLQAIEKKLEIVKELESVYDETAFLFELTEVDSDKDIETAIAESIDIINEIIEATLIETILNDKYDDNNAIITLHAGAGGTEAQDWVSMLYRMYSMYCENQDYNMEVLDFLEGDEAGLKSISFLVEGEKAYGYLKAEKGVHRLVRISPFDAGKRRHTSFASVDVMPQILDDDEISIKSEDLKIDTYRSSGAGGQHVNKTESAIRITHIPTGTVVACQTERSQIQNRETAMTMLKSKLISLKEEEKQKNLNQIQGSLKKIEWGSQIRSYVFCPYTLVKDHRTGFENSNVEDVMDGNIQPFILDYLQKSKQKP